MLTVTTNPRHDEPGPFGGGVAPNPRVTFTPAEDGIYFVSASACSRWFTDPHRGYQYFKSHVGTYTLSVKEVVDDYTSTTETTGLHP